MLQAYPSTAFTLAQLMARRNRRFSIPVVFTASEPLYPHQRELIAERFGAKVMDMYGMAERVAFATECEFGSMHVNPDYSYLELVDSTDSRLEMSVTVVGTSFHNLAMPLVRYKTFGPNPLDIRRMPLRTTLSDDRAGHRKSGGQYFRAATARSSVHRCSPSRLKECRTSRNRRLPRLLRTLGNPARPGPCIWARMITTSSSTTFTHLVDPGVNVDVVLRDEIPCTASRKVPVGRERVVPRRRTSLVLATETD